MLKNTTIHKTTSLCYNLIFSTLIIILHFFPFIKLFEGFKKNLLVKFNDYFYIKKELEFLHLSSKNLIYFYISITIISFSFSQFNNYIIIFRYTNKFKRQKLIISSITNFCLLKNKKTGDFLFFQQGNPQVSSALRSLTSVFGMGTGISSSSLSPEILCMLFLSTLKNT